jgi:hypothetical protein
LLRVPALRFPVEVSAVVAFAAALAGVWYTYHAVLLTNDGLEIANTALEEERDDRDEDRINRAWSLIAAAKTEDTGNMGLIQAVETLVARGIDLREIRLPGAYLNGLEAPGAILIQAHLRGAKLVRAELNRAHLAKADLSDADLFKAKLAKAKLGKAILIGTNLSEADLSGTDLIKATSVETDPIKATSVETDVRKADLRETILSGADLSGANFIQTQTLTQQQLDEACGDEATKLPPGLTVQPCAQAER